jgi:Domain of unknown function (DUF222)
VLAAWSYQPGDPPDSPVGPLSEVVDVVMAGRRLEGWALWCQLSAMARLITAWTRRPPRGDASRAGCDGADLALAGRLDDVASAEQDVCRRQGLDEEQLAPAFVAAEIGLACGLSRTKAAQLVTVARALLVERRHMRVAVLAHYGFLDGFKLHLLVARLGRLDPLVAGWVEERLIPDGDLALLEGEVDVRADPARPGELLPAVTRWTVPQLRNEIDDAINTIDPDGQAERGERARAERHVTARSEPDGMARIEAYGGAEAVAAVMTDLDATAATAKAAGDTRTRDQISTDEFFHRLSHGRYGSSATDPREGSAPGASDVTDDATANATGDDAADNTMDNAADDATADATDDGTAAGGMQKRSHQPADDSAGSGCGCGTRQGSGTGLAVGLTMPLATWLGLASDPGQLADYGPIAAALARHIAADAARDHPRTTTWQCVIADDVHGTVLGVSRPIPTPLHDPPPRLAALVKAASPTCVFPGCTVPARRCDLDHRIAYERGGATCSCNLQPLCRSHHRLKTAGLISVRLLQPGEDPDAPPGTLEWTTRTGLTYRRPPSMPVPPALAPVLLRIPGRLAGERRASAAYLRDLNHELRAAQARQHNRRLDEAAQSDPLDGDETMERPAAVLDDDPAPPRPARPLETWNDTYDDDGTWPCSA